MPRQLIRTLLALLVAGLVQGFGVTLQFALRLAFTAHSDRWGYFSDGLAMARIFVPVGVGTWLIVGMGVCVILRAVGVLGKEPPLTALYWAVAALAGVGAALAFHPDILMSPLRVVASLITTTLAGWAGFLTFLRLRR